MSSSNQVATQGVARLAELVRSAGSVVALTGAGISVPSGIPDFRSPGTGIWEKVNPMEVAHIDAFRR
ncbi:MAG: NAD-dependent deacetylase, partial [Solirubrobacteraceae bacterium]|nr:NAD-dependent deacetylase [Solirubrobacteraceae bacterium]